MTQLTHENAICHRQYFSTSGDMKSSCEHAFLTFVFKLGVRPQPPFLAETLYVSQTTAREPPSAGTPTVAAKAGEEDLFYAHIYSQVQTIVISTLAYNSSLRLISTLIFAYFYFISLTCLLHLTYSIYTNCSSFLFRSFVLRLSSLYTYSSLLLSESSKQSLPS